jgi:hypothetical protein
MSPTRYNPFQQLVSFDAGWVSSRLGGSGKPNATGWHHCRCPVHHGDSPSALALKNAPSGRLIAKCFRGCDPTDIHQVIDRLAANGPIGDIEPLVHKPSVEADTAATIAASERQAARLWHASYREDVAISRYLRGRGIAVSPPPDLRFNPALYHRISNSRSPGVVALVRDVRGTPKAVHRIWLAPDGQSKGALDPNTLSLGQMRGNAVRLAETDDAVLLAEGIETTLSAMQLTGIPGWSTVSTSGMKSVQLPPEIRQVTIAADYDEPGLAAASELCMRLEEEGRTVTMIRPIQSGADFNDIVRGIAA